MATHSSVLAWKILGMGEPGGLPFMGSHRVRHDWSDLAVPLYIRPQKAPLPLPPSEDTWKDGCLWVWKRTPTSHWICWHLDLRFPSLQNCEKYILLLINHLDYNFPFSSVQSLSCLWFFGPPWTTAHQASLSITNSRSPLKPMSIKSVIPSNHLILCHPLFLLTARDVCVCVYELHLVFTRSFRLCGSVVTLTIIF